jgi:uncharacterized protein YybS (DUF2232 family)
MQGSSAVGAAVAVTGGLYVTALVGAPVSAVLLPFVPLPGLLLGGRHGPRALLACVGLSTVLAALLLGGDAAATYLLALGAPTLAATEALRRSWSIERTVLLGATAWSAAIVVLLLASYGSPEQVVESLRIRLAEAFDLGIAATGRLGLEEEAVSDLIAGREPMVASVLSILPGAVALAGAFTMLVNVLIARSLQPWLRTVDLSTWSAPAGLIWVFIAAGFAMFVPLPWIDTCGRNVFLLLVGCYFCQGLAIVSYYLRRFRMGRGLRIATYALVATQQIVALGVVILGVFDLWVDFRRLSVVLESDD